MKIFFDGGLRPMPHGMEWAVVVRGCAHVAQRLGPGTSMEAEWLALLAAMRLADALGAGDAVLLGDAAAVIAQAEGRVRVPPACLPHWRAFDGMPRPRLRWVKRTQNLAGIALAKLRDTSD